MKIRKTMLIVVVGALLAFGSLSVGMADLTSALPATLAIQEFLVSDLGLTSSGGRDYPLFRLQFGPTASGGSAPYKLSIKVETAEGDRLLTGETDGHNYATFANKAFYNYNILDQLGGSFEIDSVIPVRIQDAIFDTRVVPGPDLMIRMRCSQAAAFWLSTSTLMRGISPSTRRASSRLTRARGLSRVIILPITMPGPWRTIACSYAWKGKSCRGIGAVPLQVSLRSLLRLMTGA